MNLLLTMSLESSEVAARMSVSVLLVTGSLLATLAGDEGYRETAYVPVKGDVYTIGFGSTTGVKKGDRITPDRALIRFLDEIENVYADGVKKCVKVPLYQHEYEAFVRLAYNIGVPTFCRSSGKGNPPNLIDLINSEQYAKACERIEAFNKGPGRKVMPGLVKRRKTERAICEGKKPKE
jgi:lysozyme